MIFVSPTKLTVYPLSPMQPIQPKRKASGLSRAKLLINTELGWMQGFPATTGRWCYMRGKEDLTLDLSGQQLSRATYTINKLVRDFPRALPKLVGDVTRWQSNHLALLELIKPSLHLGRPPVENTLNVENAFTATTRHNALELSRGLPVLASIIDHLSWYFYTRPEDFRAMIQWIAKHRSAASAVGKHYKSPSNVFFLIRLWKLASKVPSRDFQGLLDAAAQSNIHPFPMNGGYAFIARVKKQFTKPTAKPSILTVPKTTWPTELYQWVGEFNEAEPKRKKRYVRLFNTFYPPQLPDRWRCWWRQAVAENVSATKLYHMGVYSEKKQQYIQRHLSAVEKLEKNLPPSFKSHKAWIHLNVLSEPDHLAVYNALEKFHSQNRVEFTRYNIQQLYATCAVHLDTDAGLPKSIAGYITAFAVFLENNRFIFETLWPNPGKRSEKLLQWGCRQMETVVDGFTPDKKIKRLFDLASIISRTGKKLLSTYELELVQHLINADSDNQRVLNIYKHLAENKYIQNFIDFDLIDIALLATNGQAPDFNRVLDVLTHNYMHSEELLQLAQWLAKKGHQDLLLNGFMEGFNKEMETIAVAFLYKKDFRQIPLIIPHPSSYTPSWIQRYPELLHRPIKMLVAFDKGQRTYVEKTLGKDFPDPDELKAQITLLNEKITALKRQPSTEKIAPLQKRLDNLRSRLSHSKIPGKNRLENLRSKLLRQFYYAVLSDWKKRLLKQIGLDAVKTLRVQEAPAWVFAENILKTLPAIADLPPNSRSLAFRILARRTGPPPWDFRHDQNNAGFLQQLEKLGISTAPWLDGIAPEIYNKHALRMTIGLEKDPLEALFMGEHFSTCLSPGGVNFFSVFTNIADINKQVIYGRDEYGRVLARVLLGLTDTGGILTFHIYSHIKDYDLERAFSHYIDRLAKEMKTEILPTGEVSSLMIHDWYDDGPVDIAGRFEYLNQDSSFRRKLAGIDPGNLLPFINNSIKPQTLNALTLPCIIDLSEFDKRPELIHPLLPAIRKMETMPLRTYLRMARLSRAAGSWPVLKHKINDPLRKKVIEQHRRGGPVHLEALETLADTHPSLTLAILRKTRDPGVRRWEQERNGGRLKVAGIAYIELHRKKMAKQCFQWALAAGLYRGERQFCQNMLARLN